MHEIILHLFDGQLARRFSKSLGSPIETLFGSLQGLIEGSRIAPSHLAAAASISIDGVDLVVTTLAVPWSQPPPTEVSTRNEIIVKDTTTLGFLTAFPLAVVLFRNDTEMRHSAFYTATRRRRRLHFGQSDRQIWPNVCALSTAAMDECLICRSMQ